MLTHTHTHRRAASSTRTCMFTDSCTCTHTHRRAVSTLCLAQHTCDSEERGADALPQRLLAPAELPASCVTSLTFLIRAWPATARVCSCSTEAPSLCPTGRRSPRCVSTSEVCNTGHPVPCRRQDCGFCHQRTRRVLRKLTYALLTCAGRLFVLWVSTNYPTEWALIDTLVNV